MTSMPVTFAIEPLPVGAGFRLSGELDLATAPQLGAALQSAERGEDLVLDVGALTFIDSSGCNALLSYLRTRDDGTRITIVNASAALARTLELMGLGRHPGIEIGRDDTTSE